jgi:riboflavin synthase
MSGTTRKAQRRLIAVDTCDAFWVLGYAGDEEMSGHSTHLKKI